MAEQIDEQADQAETAERPLPSDERVRVSTRDDDELRRRLGAWLVSRHGDPAAAVTAYERPQSNGMSSDTVMFDAEWSGGGGSFVARLAPSDDAFPVFPTYDLAAQARVMQLVGERTSVPVPTVRWFESSLDPLGTPFLVMDRVDGRVPPDVMPYTMGSWVTEATEAERAELQEAAVGLLAGIHGLEASRDELAFLPGGAPDDGTGRTAMRRHFDAERAYYEWVASDLDTPLLDRAFAWLEDHWPADADAAEPVLNWGDARIGNVLFQDMTPVAVLDWEMASVGPREIDVGWMIFLHRFFQDLTEGYGMPGLPSLFARDAVAETYARLTGHEPRDLDWFVTYAAARHGVIMTRIMIRQVHLGDTEPPDDDEQGILHRDSLERLMDGTYWRR